MKKSRIIALAVGVAVLLVAAFVVSSLFGGKTVLVRDGEVVYCTYGEVVSDTTEELEVPARKVGDYGVKTRTITCDLHSKLAALYAEAQKALTDGDLDAAKKALAEVVALDPTYGKARTQLDEIQAGKSPVADGGSPSTPNNSTPSDSPPSETPGEEVPTGPSVGMSIYMPDRVTGFVGQLLIVDPFVLTRDYLPEKPGSITKLVIVAEQFKDAAAASAALNGRIKAAYPTSGATLQVGGKPAYFGAKETVSAVAFVDGAILVVLEAGATSGEGETFKTTVLNIAEEIVP